MITATLAAISPPHTDVQVSSWTATNIAEFFRQEAGVEVAVGAIRRAKLRGERLFDGALDDTALAQLGITHEAEQVQIHRALDELGARLTDTPGSTWDWRLVNRRLCDWWVMPLASYAPEVLLVWSRYHSEPSGALGMLDDELDQAGPLWFWTTLLFVPSYPLFRLGSAHPISGLAGTVLHFTLFVRIVCEVLGLVFFATTVVRRLRKALWVTTGALLAYYALYWMLPGLFVESWIHINVWAVVAGIMAGVAPGRAKATQGTTMARALSGSADSFMKAANGAATAAVAATAPAQLKRHASRALIDVGHVDRYLTERQEQQGRLFCRDHLYVFLHSPTSSFGATAYATCTMLAAVACTAVYFFETVEEYGQKLHPHMQRIDASFLTIFALDIVLRCLAKLGSWRACWRGVISDGLLWVEMLCVAPLIARIAIYPTRTIEIEDSELRVMLQLTEALGVLRLLRTARYYHGAHLLVGALAESVSALRVPFFFLALLCAQFGGIMYVLEYSSDHPDKVQNAPDAMWLILCTVTTVGYGERYPTTTQGRFVMSCVSLLGITMLAMPLAIVGSRFTDSWNKRDLSLILRELQNKLIKRKVSGEMAVAAFREFDADGSGQIEWSEYRGVLSGRLKLDMEVEKLRKVFHLLDSDGGGAINYYEFCTNFFPKFEVEQICAGPSQTVSSEEVHLAPVEVISRMSSTSSTISATAAPPATALPAVTDADAMAARLSALEDAVRQQSEAFQAAMREQGELLHQLQQQLQQQAPSPSAGPLEA